MPNFKWQKKKLLNSLICRGKSGEGNCPLALAIISINYTNFHNFLEKHAFQTPVGKSRLTGPFLSQPPTSQNQPLTMKLIETPEQVIVLRMKLIKVFENGFFFRLSVEMTYLSRIGGSIKIMTLAPFSCERGRLR